MIQWYNPVTRQVETVASSRCTPTPGYQPLPSVDAIASELKEAPGEVECPRCHEVFRWVRGVRSCPECGHGDR